MNEHLHDIDDLFRNGLEGHPEVPPPSVWETVNQDLDKRQAFYYQKKYYSLKRVVRGLMLLSFVGGSFLIFNTLKNPTDKTTKLPADITKVIEDKSHKSSVIQPANKQNVEPRVIDAASGEIKPFVPSSEKNDQSANIILKESDENKQATGRVSYELQQSKIKKASYAGDALVQQEAEPDVNTIDIGNSPRKFISYLSPDHPVKSAKLPSLSADLKTIVPKDLSYKTKKNNSHGISLYAFAAPNYSFDRLEDDHHFSGPGNNRQEARRNERENVSFSTGLLINYDVSGKIFLQSGIAVTSSSSSIAPRTVYAKADNNGHTRYEMHCSSGYVYISPKGNTQPVVGDSAKTSGTISKLTYVNIPASINYKLLSGRLSLFPSAGVGLNFLTSGTATTNISNSAGHESSTTSISGLKQTYLDGQVGLGAEYGISNKISISVKPNAKIALTSINSGTPVKAYRNFISIETGLRIKL